VTVTCGTAGICARHRETSMPFSSTAGQDMHTAALQIKDERAGTRRKSCRHHAPIVPLNPNCALPALAQPLSLFLILCLKIPAHLAIEGVLTEVCGCRSFGLLGWADTLTSLSCSPSVSIYLS
jgi:hypothetical protein